MKETLCSLELSKLAKEIGFDWDCIYASENNEDLDTGPEFTGNLFITQDDIRNAWDNGYLVYLRPTLSQLQKYIREVHNINIYCTSTLWDSTKWFNNIASSHIPFTGTYEEALENGLIQICKSIKNDL